MRRAFTVPVEERLDRIARLIYGSERGGTVEALLDANPGLSLLAAAVPAGTSIVVPAFVPAAASPVTRPWD